MKTDTIFYLLFQTFPAIFFELINSPPEIANLYQFSSVEVKQLSFRIDGVFLPNEENQPIYFLEVQFQYEPNFYRRFFPEIYLYMSKTSLTTDWRGVIIYPNRQVESEYTQNFLEILNSQRVQRIYLEELENESSWGISTIKLAVAQTSEAIEIAKPLINKVRQQVTEEKTRREILELIERILIYKLPQAKKEEIEAMFSLRDLKQTRFYLDAKEEGIQQGKQLGREEGIQQGRQQAQLEFIPKLLQLGLSVEIIAQSLELPLEIVTSEAKKYQTQSEKGNK